MGNTRLRYLPSHSDLEAQQEPLTLFLETALASRPSARSSDLPHRASDPPPNAVNARIYLPDLPRLPGPCKDTDYRIYAMAVQGINLAWTTRVFLGNRGFL